MSRAALLICLVLVFDGCASRSRGVSVEASVSQDGVIVAQRVRQIMDDIHTLSTLDRITPDVAYEVQTGLRQVNTMGVALSDALLKADTADSSTTREANLLYASSMIKSMQIRLDSAMRPLMPQKGQFASVIEAYTEAANRLNKMQVTIEKRGS